MSFGQNSGSKRGLNATRHSSAGAAGSTGRKPRRQRAGTGPAVGSSGFGRSAEGGPEEGVPDRGVSVGSVPESAGGSPTPDADPFATARSIVLRQLTLAPKSRHQLASKLAERDVPDEVAVAVLDRFEEVELIDDAEFAMMWVRSRASTRSLARSALKRELAEKGIRGDIAEEALAQVSDEEERDAAEELVRRKHRPGTVGPDRAARDKETRRLVSMLGRKGYAPSLAFGVVRSVLDDTAEDMVDPDFG